MANPKHAASLTQVFEQWTDQTRDNPGVEPDLSGEGLVAVKHSKNIHESRKIRKK
jgi:hypothetical protein